MLQQEVRVAWMPDRLLLDQERLEQEYPAGLECALQRREERALQVADIDNAIISRLRQREALQICLQKAYVEPSGPCFGLYCAQAVEGNVNRVDRATTAGEKHSIASRTGSDIEHPAAKELRMADEEPRRRFQSAVS